MTERDEQPVPGEAQPPSAASLFDRISALLITAQVFALIAGVVFRPSLPARVGAILITMSCGLLLLRRWRHVLTAPVTSVYRSLAMMMPLALSTSAANLLMPVGGRLGAAAWVLMPLLFYAGAMLLWRGFQFRRHTGLFCARCKYPLDPASPPPRCPECGAGIGRLFTTVKEHFERRQWLIAAGCALMLWAAGLLIAPILSPSKLSPYRILPDSVLVRVAPGEARNFRLWQNVESRKLAVSDRSALIDGVLAARSEDTRSTDDAERWLTQQVAAGLLTPSQLERFLSSYAALELRVQKAGNDASSLRVVLDGVTRGSWFPSVTVYAHIVSAETDGLPIAFEPESLNLFEVTPGIRRIKELRDEPAILPTLTLAPTHHRRTVLATVWLVAANSGDAGRHPSFDAAGGFVPSPSHLCATRLQIECTIEPDAEK